MYLDYFQRFIHIEIEILWDIDWHLHERVLSSLIKKDISIAKKIMWKIIYTGEMAYRQGRSESPKFVLCCGIDSSLQFLTFPIIQQHLKVVQEFQKLQQKITALHISAIMWHIIRCHIEGGQLTKSGDPSLKRTLKKNYEKQQKLSSEHFIFGRLI